jgi:hypothetical protein
MSPQLSIAFDFRHGIWLEVSVSIVRIGRQSTAAGSNVTETRRSRILVE